MAKITNEGKQPRAFHVASKGDYVELDKGQSADLTAADLERLKSSPAFVGSCGPGALVIEGEEEAEAPAAKPKGKRGRKAKAETAPDGETAEGDEDGEDDEGEPGSNG